MARLCIILTTIVSAMYLRTMILEVAERKRILNLRETNGGTMWTAWHTVKRYTLSFLQFWFYLLYAIYTQLTVIKLTIFVLKYLPAGFLIYNHIKYAFLSSRERVQDKQIELEDVELQVKIVDMKLCIQHANLKQLSDQLQRDTKILNKIIRLLCNVINVNKTLSQADDEYTCWRLDHDLHLYETQMKSLSITHNSALDCEDLPETGINDGRKKITNDNFSEHCNNKELTTLSSNMDIPDVKNESPHENEVIHKGLRKQLVDKSCNAILGNNCNDGTNINPHILYNSTKDNQTIFGIVCLVDDNEFNKKQTHKIIKCLERTVTDNGLETSGKLSSLPNKPELNIKLDYKHSSKTKIKSQEKISKRCHYNSERMNASLTSRYTLEYHDNISSISNSLSANNSVILTHNNTSESSSFEKQQLKEDNNSSTSSKSHRNVNIDSSKQDNLKEVTDMSTNNKTAISSDVVTSIDKDKHNDILIDTHISSISNASAGTYIIAKVNRKQDYILNSESTPIRISNRNFTKLCNDDRIVAKKTNQNKICFSNLNNILKRDKYKERLQRTRESTNKKQHLFTMRQNADTDALKDFTGSLNSDQDKMKSPRQATFPKFRKSCDMVTTPKTVKNITRKNDTFNSNNLSECHQHLTTSIGKRTKTKPKSSANKIYSDPGIFLKIPNKSKTNNNLRKQSCAIKNPDSYNNILFKTQCPLISRSFTNDLINGTIKENNSPTRKVLSKCYVPPAAPIPRIVADLSNGNQPNRILVKELQDNDDKGSKVASDRSRLNCKKNVNTVVRYAHSDLKLAVRTRAVYRTNTFHDISQSRIDYEMKMLNFLHIPKKDGTTIQYTTCLHNSPSTLEESSPMDIVALKTEEKMKEKWMKIISKPTYFRSRSCSKMTNNKTRKYSPSPLEKLQFTLLRAQKLLSSSLYETTEAYCVTRLNELRRASWRRNSWQRGSHGRRVMLYQNNSAGKNRCFNRTYCRCMHTYSLFLCSHRASIRPHIITARL